MTTLAQATQGGQSQEAPQQQLPLTSPVPPSDEDLMSRFIAPAPEQQAQPAERPRDAQGRFVAGEQEQAQPQTEEKPAAEVKEPEEKQEATQEEVKWDEVKDIKLKIPMKNGEKEWEEEVTLADLREGRMLKADYTQKTQELAEQRRQVEAHTQQAMEKERTQYLSALETLHRFVLQAAAPDLANVDWSRLAAENPNEYVRLSNRAREVNAAQEAVRMEYEKVLGQQSKERKERLDKAVEESRAKLKEAIPSWSDDLYQTLLKRGVDTYGFKADEVSQVYDSRVMRVLHDAHQFHLLKDAKPASEKKVVAVPPVLKRGASEQKPNPQTQQANNARTALAKNGNDIDAAAAVMGSFIQPVRR
jgi:hypothetical protein